MGGESKKVGEYMDVRRKVVLGTRLIRRPCKGCRICRVPKIESWKGCRISKSGPAEM